MNTPDLTGSTMQRLTQVFESYPELRQVRLYGSRATGKATPRSDIDLVTLGIVNEHRLGRLALDLDDLPISQKCDLQAYESIRYAPFKRHIDTYGITIYENPSKQKSPPPQGED